MTLGSDQNFTMNRFCIRYAIRLVIFCLSLIVAQMCASDAYACTGCRDPTCDNASTYIEQAHDRMEDYVKQEFDDDLEAYEEWWIEEMVGTEAVAALGDMASQMAATAMLYTEAIGMFLDAQNQIETQRLFRELQFQAHKDYRISEGFCMFGSNVKSLAATENKSRYNALALSRISVNRQLGKVNSAGSEDSADDYKARWDQFVDTYCDIRDNNYITGAAGSGLALACDHDGPGGSADAGAERKNRINRDINYTRLIEEPKTIDADFTNTTLDSENILITGPIEEPGDEEDILALSRNLYGHKVLARNLSQASVSGDVAKRLYLSLRSVVAKRSVAQATFNAIVGMKSSGTAEDLPVAYATQQTRRFLAAIVNELLPADPTASAGNIFDLIGYDPSYFSQLEILGKRIYQNPTFYSDLYDTPANVSRKKVAMQAIELMLDRAIYESQLRREMSVSVLLASKLRSSHRAASRGVSVGGTAE